MVFFVLSRALGLVRDIVISHQFGTSRALDAYFAAFNVPDFIFNILAGGALGSAFIPTFSEALTSNDKERAWYLASAIINVVIIAMTTISVLFALFTPQIVAATVGRGFSLSDQALTADLMRWMLITPIVFGVSGIVMGILNSHQHFVLPALAPVLYNAAIIAGAIVFAPTMGVYGLVAGVVGGAFLHLLVQLPWLIRARMRYAPMLGFANSDVREVGRLMLPRALGIAAVQVNFLVNTILASSLPAGAIAALSYAWRVMLLPVGVVGQSLGTAVFPTLSGQTARREAAEFRQTFSNAFRTTLFLSIPASVGLFMLAMPVVALLFQRGEFGAQSVAETALALQFYAIGLFAHSGLEILTRAFYAMHDTKTPVLVGVAAMGLNVALSLALIVPLAQGGLALANSIATILETVTLFFLLRRRLADIDASRIGISVVRVLLASLGMALAILLFSNSLSSLGAVTVAIGATVVGGAVYFVTTIVLKADEMSSVINILKRSTQYAARDR